MGDGDRGWVFTSRPITPVNQPNWKWQWRCAHPDGLFSHSSVFCPVAGRIVYITVMLAIADDDGQPIARHHPANHINGRIDRPDANSGLRR
jgi:hypothetical protein